MYSILQQAARAMQSSERILGHWLAAVPILMLVAGLAISRVDKFAPSSDSFLSLYNAGLATGGGSIDVLHSLQTNSPQQGPIYYLLLNTWGRLMGRELALARMLSVFTSLLGFAVLYRLAHDHIAPIAGFFAIFLLASNAFYGHYIAFVRMYSVWVLFAATAVWLYLRLIDQEKPRATTYAALSVTIYALLCTHAFGLLLFAAVGIGHLAIKRDRVWARIFLAALVALGCFVLTVLLLGTGATPNYVPNPATVGEFVGAWLMIVSNNNILLLALTTLGWLGLRRERNSRLGLLMLMLVAFTAFAGATSSFVSVGRARYLLNGLPLAICVLAGLLYGCFRLHRLFGLLMLTIWLLAGWQFANNADWDDLLGHFFKAYETPSWHVISREARLARPAPLLVSYRPSHGILTKGKQINFSMSDYFFGQYGIQVRQTFEFVYLEGIVQDLTLHAPVVWLVTQRSQLNANEASEVEALMWIHGYTPCSQTDYIAGTVLTAWWWKDLQCKAPQMKGQYGNNALTYTFFGASPDAQANVLRFRYRHRADDHSAQELRISHQLLDADWRNVAQLDLPLVHSGELLQFSINIADVPAGDYRLMAIVYNAQTGERRVWQGNEGWIPEMQKLAEIVIPAASEDAS